MARILVTEGIFIEINELLAFVYEAKLKTYASNEPDPRVTRTEIGFDTEIKYKPGDSPWFYSDHYTGSYAAPGQEIVEWRAIPVWSMSYDGGMAPQYWGDRVMAKETFRFLKEALRHAPTENPYRGPSLYQSQNLRWRYRNNWVGNITRFHGEEKITYDGKVIFRQNYMGGLIIHKY